MVIAGGHVCAGMTGGRINAFNITKQVTMPFELMQHCPDLLTCCEPLP